MSVTFMGREVFPGEDLSDAFYGITPPEGWSGDIGHCTEFCIRCKSEMIYDGFMTWVCDECDITLKHKDPARNILGYFDIGTNDEVTDELSHALPFSETHPEATR